MQNCFRAHPDVYGAELEDEEAETAEAGAPAPTGSSEQPAAASADIDAASQTDDKHINAKEANTEVKPVEAAEGDFLVPKAAHDAETKSQEVQKTEN